MQLEQILQSSEFVLIDSSVTCDFLLRKDGKIRAYSDIDIFQLYKQVVMMNKLVSEPYSMQNVFSTKGLLEELEKFALLFEGVTQRCEEHWKEKDDETKLKADFLAAMQNELQKAIKTASKKVVTPDEKTYRQAECAAEQLKMKITRSALYEQIAIAFERSLQGKNTAILTADTRISSICFRAFKDTCTEYPQGIAIMTRHPFKVYQVNLDKYLKTIEDKKCFDLPEFTMSVSSDYVMERNGRVFSLVSANQWRNPLGQGPFVVITPEGTLYFPSSYDCRKESPAPRIS